ncbi:MAG: flagellar biosynthesis repressor FlbT, partial [Hyphomonadaceae bacterium]|nr:flagellar biosynthesis repressor FlbT [Hyphomonadaceae bacterium]
MPLKLSLRPGEKFVVNGAVVQNGDRRAALVLQNKASVLREKDIMQAEEADTPAKRIYFPIM